ncbi:hypothetical protein [Sphingobacterium kyonggiense]
MAEQDKGKGAAQAAPKAPQGEAKPKQKRFVVVNPFSDLHDISKKYDEGDDVSHFSQERLQSAINRGLVKEA